MTTTPAGPVRLHSAHRPALVAGADTPTGLALARSLDAHGIPVVGTAADPTAPTCRSRHWSDLVAAPGPWLDALRTAHARHGRLVLLPADDAVVRVVAEHRGLVDTLADVVLPDRGAVETLLDKTAFHPWASERGFPVPATAVVDSPDALDLALATMRYPVVLKPFERTAAWRAASPRDKVIRLDGPAELDRRGLRPFDLADKFVVQEWIPGLDSDVWFCLAYRDRTGATTASVVGRKITQWPVDTGSSALAVTAHDPELAALTRRVLDAAGHVGFGSLEVRRSRRDGRAYITEPTVGRPNLQTALAHAAGVDLALTGYRDAAGLPPLPQQAPRPAVWRHETAFPRSLVVAGLRGRLDVPAVLGTALAAATGHRRRVAAFGAADDRIPARAEWARLVRRVAHLRPVAMPVYASQLAA